MIFKQGELETTATLNDIKTSSAKLSLKELIVKMTSKQGELETTACQIDIQTRLVLEPLLPKVTFK